MRIKVLILLCLLTSLIGYLEWGEDQYGFLVSMEWEILKKLLRDPASAIHPFVLLPIAGQVLLLFTLFQRRPSRLLIFTGLGFLALLMLLIFGIGILGAHIRILLSAVPFLFVSGVLVSSLMKLKQA